LNPPSGHRPRQDRSNANAPKEGARGGTRGSPTTRVAIVTGGASGIGRAAAERLLRGGWSVVVADVNERPVDGASFVRVDVSREDDVAAAVAHARETYGRLDCMVNNAGVGGAFGPLTELHAEDWDYTFAVVVRGVFLGTKHAARALIEQGEGGSIVNVGSIAGTVGGMAPQAYSAAKAAVVHFTRIAAAELAPHRIRVNSVSPGVIRTPLVDQTTPDVAAALEGIQPWPDVGEPDDVAKVIEFLAGDAGFVTGEDVVVDGGLVAAGARIRGAVGNDPGLRGLVGVSRGTTGEKSTVRARLPE
jgi:NAD(P)-dependent dehydrogenase (short-subunit alcohol dehydrogenase family)